MAQHVDFDKLNLGSTSRLVILDSAEDHCHATISLLAQAQHHIQILSTKLEPEIYNDAAVVNAFMRFVRRAPNARIEILLVDTQSLHHSQHQLIQLGKAYPQQIKFRHIVDEFSGTTETFIIADEIGLIWRQHMNEYTAVANFCAPRDAKAKGELHHRIWEISAEDPDL